MIDYDHDCTACRLHLNAKTVCVPARRQSNAIHQLMLVGEAPGAREDEVGKPFVGRAGRELQKALDALELSPDDYTITNVVKCRPPGNRDPLDDEAATCAFLFLDREIAAYRPRAIVALGAVATRALTGASQRMGQLRGNWLYTGSRAHKPVPVMPTWHPSYVMRKPEGDEVHQQLQQDILRAAERQPDARDNQNRSRRRSR